jgi:benzoylformate decarboxylase
LDATTSAAKEVLAASDLLIGIGCPMFGQAFYNSDAPSLDHLKIIQFDEDPWQIGKNIPVDCGIQANIKAALTEINAMAEATLSTEDRKAVAARIDTISAQKKQQTEGLKKQIDAEKDRQPIAVSRLMAELKSVVTKETVVVDDCWSSSAMLRGILDLTKPATFFRARNGGSIGSGLPMALGVQLALADKKVIAVSGDGSAAWSMQTLWTAAKYNIPVTFVITNNATYRQVKLTRKVVLGDYPLNEKHDGMELDNPIMDFCMLAESMGVKGFKVTTPEQLASTLKEAVDMKVATLVEVVVENAP